MPLELIQPQWPAHQRVHAAFTTRAGGVSVAPFDTFNLGDHVHDKPEHVALNRAALQRSLQARPVFLKQVHGVDAVGLRADTADGAVADACFTRERQLACTIMVADCLPVLFTDRAGSFVAAAHAGWRGLVGQDGVGVLEQTFQSVRQSPPVNHGAKAIKIIANDVLAWLGPCIGPRQFEVGAEVKAAFEASQTGAAQHFRAVAQSADKYLADLPALARDRLGAMGITQIYGNDGAKAWCTVSQPLQFFSHRRDAVRLGSTGRMAACIWLAS
jgi:polyphenol oxidase